MLSSRPNAGLISAIFGHLRFSAEGENRKRSEGEASSSRGPGEEKGGRRTSPPAAYKLDQSSSSEEEDNQKERGKETDSRLFRYTFVLITN